MRECVYVYMIMAVCVYASEYVCKHAVTVYWRVRTVAWPRVYLSVAWQDVVALE